MSDNKDYYNYIPEYNEFKGVENSLDDQTLYKHPVYKNIPYYNNEIKSLQDINKNYSVSENMDNMYYRENPEFENSNDVNLIYNDGFPSYRMVSPRVVDVSHRTQNNNSSVSSDVSNLSSSRNENPKVSEISKLADAIKEFTSKMPLPPSPELLKLVHPNLAVELQLTFLKAYIQNQQLLLDLKSKIDVAFSGSEFAKFTSDLTGQTNKEFQTDSNTQNYPIVEFRAPYASLATQQATAQSNFNYKQFGGDYNYGTNLNVESNSLQNFPISQISCPPQLTNYPNFYYPLTQQPNFSLPQLTNFPQNTNYPQLTNYPHFSDGSNYQYGPGEVDNQSSSGFNGEYKEGVDDYGELKNPALLVPEEYRDRVKYSSSKKSFVSVFLNSLGIRRRKFFSINKFGLNTALSMAINFSNQLSLNNKSNKNKYDKKTSSGKSDNEQNGVSVPCSDISDSEVNGMDVDKENFRLAVRERNLIEEVCEHALKLNYNSVENFELFDKALEMDRIRGLVYIPGANFWMCIFYKKRKRKLQCFNVEEFGFDKCYHMGQTFFKNNPQVVRSKLSGVLSYWLEPRPTKTLVVIFKIRTNVSLTKSYNYNTNNSNNTNNNKNNINTNNRDNKDELDVLYLGRFELEVYGGFLSAKKASQGWCNHLNKHNGQLNLNKEEINKTTKLDGSKNSTVDNNNTNSNKENMNYTNKDNTNNKDSCENLWNKLGFVYYDDYNKLWVVVRGSQTFPFSANTLGHLESKKQAIALRQQHILNHKSTNL